MNAKIKFIGILIIMLSVQTARAQSAASAVRQGNTFYAQNKFNDAIKKYDEAIVDDPLAIGAKFNKANSFYRLDDLANASDLYKAVAAGSKDMELVEKAKYSLGNCSYQQGLKQKDSDLQKSLEDFKTSIEYWRQALDINPRDDNAAKNIEVARLMIKDIIDQINKQKKQQDPNNPQDNKQQQNQQQQKDNKQQNGSKGNDPNQQQQKKSESDPNKSQEPNQPKEQQKKQDQQEQKKNQDQKQQSQEQKEQKQQQEQQSDDKKEMTAPDATAQEILDREQKDRKEREMLQRGGYQKVDKDW